MTRSKDGTRSALVRKTPVSEYKRAVEMFIQLHGDLPVAAIKKSHAREYREALQEVPHRRTAPC